MAGTNFTSPNQPSSKMHVGKANRPKRSSEASHGPGSKKLEYPITDSFASKTLPGFASRRAKDNPKTGFNTQPTKASYTGFVREKRVASPERGRGHEHRAQL